MQPIPRRALALAGACSALLSAAAAPADAKPPRGYQVVVSPILTAPHLQGVRGFVLCPPGTVPLGGGSFVSSSSTQVSIGGTFPTPTGWTTDVDNESTSDTIFDVRATCARKPPRYAVVQSAPVAVGPNTSGAAFAVCPKGSRTIGGGGVWDTGGTELNLSSSFPEPFTWEVSGNNTTTLTAHLTAFAVCGKLKNYQLVFSVPSTVGIGQTPVTNTCFAPRVPISGGVSIDSISPHVSLNATLASGAGWTSFVNNATGFGVDAEPIVVCAGT